MILFIKAENLSKPTWPTKPNISGASQWELQTSINFLK